MLVRNPSYTSSETCSCGQVRHGSNVHTVLMNSEHRSLLLCVQAPLLQARCPAFQLWWFLYLKVRQQIFVNHYCHKPTLRASTYFDQIQCCYSKCRTLRSTPGQHRISYQNVPPYHSFGHCCWRPFPAGSTDSIPNRTTRQVFSGKVAVYTWHFVNIIGVSAPTFLTQLGRELNYGN